MATDNMSELCSEQSSEERIEYAYDPIKGKVVAGKSVFHEGKKYFVKEVKRAKHFFKLVDGYAIDRSVFKRLDDYEGIRINEIDTGDSYWASISTWKENGGNWTGKSGNQQTLSQKYMNKVLKKKGQHQG